MCKSWQIYDLHIFCTNSSHNKKWNRQIKHASFVAQRFFGANWWNCWWKSQLENKTSNKIHAAYDEMNIPATWKGTNCSSSVCEWAVPFADTVIRRNGEFPYERAYSSNGNPARLTAKQLIRKRARTMRWYFPCGFFFCSVRRKKTDVCRFIHENNSEEEENDKN